MKTTYFMMAIVATMLTACSNDENEVPQGPVEAQVTAGMGAATRAVNDTWTAGDAIGVMVTGAPTSGADMTDRYKNVKYTAAATGTSATFTAEAGKGIFFQDASEEVTFAAYYPYQESAQNDALPGTDGVITVDTKDNNVEENQPKIDFLYATGATASKSNSAVEFADKTASGGNDNQFKHQMAQLTLVVKASTLHGFTDAEARAIFGTTAMYKLGGLKHAGTFNVTTGAAAPTTAAAVVAGWDITGCMRSDVVDAYTRTYTLILLPQNVSRTPLTFSIAVDGQTYTNSTAINPNLESGKTYTYTITVKKSGLTVSGCTIAAWTAGTTGVGDAIM